MDQLAHPDPVARARGVAASLAAASDAVEATRRIPEPLLTELHDARLTRMLLPRSAGGDEVEPGAYLLAVEEISRHDASVGWNIFVANSATLIAAYLPAETARMIYADPRTLIAWGPPNACRAAAVPGGYRVNGRWDFASGCRQATWMGAHCHVVEPDGSLRLDTAGRPTIRSMLFPVDRATLLDTWHTIGLCGTASNSYTVEDVFVPEAFSTTREDPTLRRETGPLYAFTMQGLYAVGVAGVALGTARAMLETLVDLTARKAPRRLARMADDAVVQASIARAEARHGAARAYLLEILADVYAKADRSAPSDIPDRARVRLACSNAIQAAIEVANFSYRRRAWMRSSAAAFERRFRDIHTLSQQIQSRDAHFEAVGKVLLGVPPAVFF